MRYLALLMCLSACTSQETTPPLNSNPDIAVPETTQPHGDLLQGPIDCDSSTLRVSAIHPWAGGGLQLLVSTTDADPMAVGSLSRTPWPMAESTIESSVGLTGIVLYGSEDPVLLESRVKEAIDFLNTLPDSERLVVWHAGKQIELLADTTRNKEHVIARLEAVEPQKPLAVGFWLQDLAASLERLGDPFAIIHRHLVLVGAVSEGSVIPLVRTVELCSLGAEGCICRDGRSFSESRHGMRRIGICPPYEVKSLLLRSGANLCQVPLPDRLSPTHPSCDPGYAAIDHYPYGTEIHIELSEDQKALYDEYAAAQSQEAFTGTVTIGEHLPEEASLHFRGATSMHCGRKSLKVNLEGNQLRRFLPGGSGDEVYLISLCKDDRYFNQVFANRLLHEMHQFPLVGRYIRLKVNGKNLGAYYMLEHAKEKLLSEHVALTALVRRRFDPHDKPEDIKFPDDADGIEKAQAAYDTLANIALNHEAEGLIEALEEHIDLSRYLRWLAFNTFMRNGDTIDEAFFFASQEVGKPYFRHMGWDADDLFSDCHHYSKYALVDPHELIYCAEGNLDQALLRSPALYERYVTILEELLLSELTPSTLNNAMDAIEADLWTVISDDETALGLKELHTSNPDTVTAQAARADIRSHMQAMLAEAEERRALLLERIALYRSND